MAFEDFESNFVEDENFKDTVRTTFFRMLIPIGYKDQHLLSNLNPCDFLSSLIDALNASIKESPKMPNQSLARMEVFSFRLKVHKKSYSNLVSKMHCQSLSVDPEANLEKIIVKMIQHSFEKNRKRKCLNVNNNLRNISKQHPSLDLARRGTISPLSTVAPYFFCERKRHWTDYYLNV